MLLALVYRPDVTKFKLKQVKVMARLQRALCPMRGLISGRQRFAWTVLTMGYFRAESGQDHDLSPQKDPLSHIDLSTIRQLRENHWWYINNAGTFGCETL